MPTSRSFCDVCHAGVQPIGPACPRCAEPEGPTGACPCRRIKRPWRTAAASLIYAGPTVPALLRFKHGSRLDLARPLGRLLATPLRMHLAAGDRAVAPALVTPVPLHPRRLRKRGYNQSLELARSALRELRLGAEAPVCVLLPDLLVRVRDTPSLGHLGVADRAAAVADAFRVRASSRLTPSPRGRDVILVDDVMTTGATLAACAGALMQAGARDVRVLALARAPRS